MPLMSVISFEVDRKLHYQWICEGKKASDVLFDVLKQCIARIWKYEIFIFVDFMKKMFLFL